MSEDGLPQPSQPNTPATPGQAPAPEISLPKPSATVQSFQSGGGPPEPPKPKSTAKGKVIFVLWLVLILGALGGGWYYFIFQQHNLPFINKPVTPTPSPAVTDQLEKDYQDTTQSMGDLDNNLTDVDSTLGDKQGDLTE